jgi:hypothetical protein
MEGWPAVYNLPNFTLSDMTTCGAALRKLGTQAASLEDVAQAIVGYLFEQFRDGPANGPACALVRLFVTRSFARLDADLQSHARQLLGGESETADMKCLLLAGTAGVRPEWNSRNSSVRYRAIPLATEAMLRRSSMISQLVNQLGLEVNALLRPDPALLVDLEQKSYNVFHVAEARGSLYVPAQDDFVIPCGIRSVVGFGGMLPLGNLFAVILFTTVPLARETADLFRPMALSVKLALLPFASAG